MPRRFIQELAISITRSWWMSPPDRKFAPSISHFNRRAPSPFEARLSIHGADRHSHLSALPSRRKALLTVQSQHPSLPGPQETTAILPVPERLNFVVFPQEPMELELPHRHRDRPPLGQS